jgi:hypothetical protein
MVVPLMEAVYVVVGRAIAVPVLIMLPVIVVPVIVVPVIAAEERVGMVVEPSAAKTMLLLPELGFLRLVVLSVLMISPPVAG